MTALSLNDVGFSYGTHQILSGISCSFKPGRFYSILGPNGSGKTTLLDLISGFHAAESGSVMIDKNKLNHYSKAELARIIALVSQDYTINFPFPVKEVVMMGRHPYIPRFSNPSPEDYDIVDYTMETCGIYPLKDKKITELSGGEKQRCVFARALCQDTPILLLDEAFSNLDIRHTLQLLKIVKTSVEKKGKLVISVFHDLNIASAWSDSVLMLKRGRIKGFGRTLDIFTRETIRDVFNINAVIEYNEHVGSNQIYYPAQ